MEVWFDINTGFVLFLLYYRIYLNDLLKKNNLVDICSLLLKLVFYKFIFLVCKKLKEGELYIEN